MRQTDPITPNSETVGSGWIVLGIAGSILCHN